MAKGSRQQGVQPGRQTTQLWLRLTDSATAESMICTSSSSPIWIWPKVVMNVGTPKGQYTRDSLRYNRAVVSIIAGATGLVGGHLASELVGVVGQQVVALVRRTAPALPPQVTQVVCDFARLDSLTPAPAEAVFCALGTTIAKAGSREAFRQVDYEAILALGRYGRRCGARQFSLVSSVGASLGSFNFYLRVKAEVERDLAALGYQALHIFRPGVLVGNRAESRPGERLGVAISKALGPLLIGLLVKYRAIDASWVASAMARASQEPTTGISIYHYREIAAMAGRP